MRTNTIRSLAIACAEAFLENVDNPDQERIQVRLKNGQGVSVVVRVYAEGEEEEVITEDHNPLKMVDGGNLSNDSDTEDTTPISIAETVKAGGTEGTNKPTKGKTSPK